MILRIKGFDLDISIEDGESTILEILDKQLFRSIIKSIKDNIFGFTNNDVVIECDENIVNYTKNVECVQDYFGLEINSKSIIQTLYKSMEEDIKVDVELQYKIESLLLELSNLLRTDIEDYGFGICNNVSTGISNLLKLFDFKIDINEYPTILDKLYLYIELIAYFNSSKLIIFVNIKSYFNKNELIEIYKYLNYKKVKFLCIEANSSDIIETEVKYLIDEDLVEFGPFR